MAHAKADVNFSCPAKPSRQYIRPGAQAPTNQNQNSDARPSGWVSGAKSALGAGTSTNSASSRATASTFASKARSVDQDLIKGRVKRKREREPFVVVVNKRPKAVIPPSMRRVVVGVPSRRLTTVSRADTEATINKPFPELVDKIEIGDPRHNTKLAKEGGRRVVVFS